MKTIRAKISGKMFSASVSDKFFQKIMEYMATNHYRNRSALIRKSIRVLINGAESIASYMEANFYSSKAELVREALRELIMNKARTVITMEKPNKYSNNDESWKKIQEKKEYEKKWNRLPIIPGAETLHPYHGQEFANRGGITSMGNCLAEMKEVWALKGITV